MKHFSEHLSLLERRVHRAVLDELSRLVTSSEEVPTSLLLSLAGEYAERAMRARTELASWRVAHARAQSHEEKQRVLASALTAQNAKQRAFRALERGLFDLDALSERTALAASVAETRVALCLRIAACTVVPEQAAPLIEQCCSLLADWGEHPLASGAAEALAALFTRKDTAIQISDDAFACMVAPLVRARGSRRVQAALARAALGARRADAIAVLRMRLIAPPHEQADDFLLRQHFVMQLGALGRATDTFFTVRELALLGDPSEHVRTALPEALRRTGGGEAVALLSQLGQDASYRVRARAGLALIALLTNDQLGELTAIAALCTDADARVRRIVLEELEAVLVDGGLPKRHLASLAKLAARAAALAGEDDAAEPAIRLGERIASELDPELLDARSDLAERLVALPRSHSLTVASRLPPRTFGRVLALLSRNNFGLYAEPITGGYRITHGATLVRRLWRILHELRTRTPYKRQDQLHSVGRHFNGPLRAHSEQLAEATPTIPGEPLAVTRDGLWGTHLPTVDDFLSLPLFGPAEASLFSARGITTITGPEKLAERLRLRVALSRDYASLAADRNRALSPKDPGDVTRYRERLSALGASFSLEPYSRNHALAHTLPSPSPSFAPGTETMALALLPWSDWAGDSARYFLSPSENTLPQLTVAATLALSGLLAANIARRHRIQLDRESIPLVLGGWGTRGKSGTERLKAAMLHGQGLNVLVKTTGCEAMFIHGVPGRKPSEIFIHRSYDKATIWEQRNVLALGSRLGVQAFLWECMALSPPLVRTLQEEWMRDDLSTLTNAYPDHEDIQGPAGVNVAEVIASFMRTGGTTITSEEQMLPVFVEEARKKGTRLIAVARREHELLADDLLARFPYNEHPRNIALVRRLAEELGLDPDLATADMADHVVPDLGVLKAYPEVKHSTRCLTFVNGMSANERTGFLSNWQRMGCEKSCAESVERGRWTVTVVNNRYDRVARSKVFADILVRDAAAERHVLIGTNLVGLRRYIEQALEPLLDELAFFQRGDASDAVSLRAERMRHRLRIGPATAEAVLGELESWLGQHTAPLASAAQATLGAVLARADAGDGLENLLKLARDSELCLPLPDEHARFLARSVARRALFASLEQAAFAAANEPARHAELNRRQREVYRTLFLESVVTLEDPAASGDRVIDFIVSAIPPGVNATLMGTQNIKGTGLDFVYRFVRYEEVKLLTDRLAHASVNQARELADELAARSDWGMLDRELAEKALGAAATRMSREVELAVYLSDVARSIGQRPALKDAEAPGKSSRLKRWLGKALDAFDAVNRRLRADQILDLLVHQEISHERAALEARRLVEREKNGWLT